MSRRLAKVAADLLGVENVRIYHDQALFKEPGGGPTPWHQDQYYWPIDTDKTITMWMPLVDIDVRYGHDNFRFRVLKKKEVFSTMKYPMSQIVVFDKYVHENNFEISRAKTMKAGDAVLAHRFYYSQCSRQINPIRCVKFLPLFILLKMPGSQAAKK